MLKINEEIILKENDRSFHDKSTLVPGLKDMAGKYILSIFMSLTIIIQMHLINCFKMMMFSCLKSEMFPC